MRKELRARPVRTALAAALWLAMTGAHGAAPDPFAVAMPSPPGGGRGVAALMQSLRKAAVAQRRGAAPQAAQVLPVTDCSDEGGAGTLRSVIQAANSGDTVDLSALSCSTITLTQGAIGVMQDALTLAGPGAGRLALVGNGSDRLFIHYGADTLTLRALTVRDGVQTRTGYHLAGGACILAAYNVALEQATVTGCVSTGEGAYGGAILAGHVVLRQSTISGNVAQGSLLQTLTASYGGGAFAFEGTIYAYDSTVSNNRAQADPNNTSGRYDTGGGLFSDNGGYLYRSTLDNNVSDGTGGGFAAHGSVVTVDSTISGNSAATRGGGLFLRSTDPIGVENSTVAFNQAGTNGGGIYVQTAGGFVMQSTILAHNSAPLAPDIGSQYAGIIVGSNNLVMAPGANVFAPFDTLNSDPKLGPLANNGGPTRTHALQLGSPALEHGNNLVGLAFDQRGVGFPRVAGSAADIGAFEASAATAARIEAAPAGSRLGAGLLVVGLAALGWRRRRRRT